MKFLVAAALLLFSLVAGSSSRASTCKPLSEPTVTYQCIRSGG